MAYSAALLPDAAVTATMPCWVTYICHLGIGDTVRLGDLCDRRIVETLGAPFRTQRTVRLVGNTKRTAGLHCREIATPSYGRVWMSDAEPALVDGRFDFGDSLQGSQSGGVEIRDYGVTISRLVPYFSR
eukprot:SAG11_NODE_15412_length_579_cov_0.966667_1_plen_128_part_01